MILLKFVSSSLKCNLFSSKKNREAGDAKPKHFLGLVLIFDGNPQGTLRCKWSSFSSGNTAKARP